MNNHLKNFLGDIPYSAELIWLLRQTGKPPVGGYSLEKMQKALPGWVAQAQVAQQPKIGKKVLVFTMLRYWLEQTTMLSLALSALGYEVTLAYLPYAHWKKPVNKFDLRRQNLYMRDMLEPLEVQLNLLSLLDASQVAELPEELNQQMKAAAFRDVQYSLLREEVESDSELYHLRMERNQTHARAMLQFLQTEQPDVVIVPNGSILEFGITFKVARYLDIPVVSYEFGEQSERMWLAQNADVMRQETGDLWAARGDLPLTDEQWIRVKEFFSARQGGGLWENFSRRWQGTVSQGGEAARTALELDARPVVLLPANVLGDSLTLGRHIFSGSMTEWLERTIQFFQGRPDIQFVIRVHPGEQMGWGPSVYDILKEKFPTLPEHIHLLPADARVNTYDLVNTADLGLVFTTTVGMEMAMCGLPVIVTGQTHYRNKGFTYDPDSWTSYFETLSRLLASPREGRPSRQQVESAWTYAYRFFFEYPRPFPWHVQHFWEDEAKWPLERVLSSEGIALFGDTFRYLVGEPLEWGRSTVPSSCLPGATENWKGGRMEEPDGE
jgi:hypothetical protein